MLNSNRIKRVSCNSGSLTIGGGGSLTVYDIFGTPINGEILKIDFTTGNYANGGSFGLCVSGTNERIWTWNDADTTVSQYVFATGYNVDGTGSATLNIRPVVLDGLSTLYVWSSGCTAEKSGGQITLYYR